MKKSITIEQKQYELYEQIGEGSHAHVWCAKARFYPYDELTVKIAKEDETSKERVKNEIWFLKEVQHVNIPQLLAFDDSTSPWLAMPLLQRLSLTVPDKGQLKEYDISNIGTEGYPKQAPNIPFEYRHKTAVMVLHDISNVINYISGTGIVHADISPGNIMESKGSILKKNYLLTDWGATALMYHYPEKSFGSLHFTAPERLFGQVGTKSDLFSLGITAFYILTGTVPYKGTTGEDYYVSITQLDGASPNIIEKKVNNHLNKLIRDLIRKHPEHRPDPSEVCSRIDRIKTKIF